MFENSRVELILPSELMLMLGFLAFAFVRDFYTQSYCSTDFYVNVCKHKSLYFQLTFNQNQCYKINREPNIHKVFKVIRVLI